MTIEEHLAGEVTTLCHCWRLTRTDGWQRGFTDHDVPLAIDGIVCEPQTGFSQSEAKSELGLGASGLDIEGALSADIISEADVHAGLFDGAEIEAFLVNWQAPAKRRLLRKAVIGKITLADGRFLAELESPLRRLDRVTGRYLRRSCDAELGDGRCRVNLDAPGRRGTGIVAAAVGPRSFRVEGLTAFSPGWFSHGRLTTSTGITTAVEDHRKAGEEVVLVIAGDLVVGDSFEVTVGCDKAFATCKAKFANALNFRGFPHLPGNDAAYGYVTDGAIFDGGPLVP